MECSQRPQALMAEAKEMTWRPGDPATRRAICILQRERESHFNGGTEVNVNRM